MTTALAPDTDTLNVALLGHTGRVILDFLASPVVENIRILTSESIRAIPEEVDDREQWLRKMFQVDTASVGLSRQSWVVDVQSPEDRFTDCGIMLRGKIEPQGAIPDAAMMRAFVATLRQFQTTHAVQHALELQRRRVSDALRAADLPKRDTVGRVRVVEAAMLRAEGMTATATTHRWTCRWAVAGGTSSPAELRIGGPNEVVNEPAEVAA